MIFNKNTFFKWKQYMHSHQYYQLYCLQEEDTYYTKHSILQSNILPIPNLTIKPTSLIMSMIRDTKTSQSLASTTLSIRELKRNKNPSYIKEHMLVFGQWRASQLEGYREEPLRSPGGRAPVNVRGSWAFFGASLLWPRTNMCPVCVLVSLCDLVR